MTHRLTPDQLQHCLNALNARPAGPGAWLGQLPTGDLVVIRDPHHLYQPQEGTVTSTDDHTPASAHPTGARYFDTDTNEWVDGIPPELCEGWESDQMIAAGEAAYVWHETELATWQAEIEANPDTSDDERAEYQTQLQRTEQHRRDEATGADHQTWTSEPTPPQAATCQNADDDGWEL